MSNGKKSNGQAATTETAETIATAAAKHAAAVAAVKGKSITRLRESDVGGKSNRFVVASDDAAFLKDAAKNGGEDNNEWCVCFRSTIFHFVVNDAYISNPVLTVRIEGAGEAELWVGDESDKPPESEVFFKMSKPKTARDLAAMLLKVAGVMEKGIAGRKDEDHIPEVKRDVKG